jgi:hypothetical protein
MLFINRNKQLYHHFPIQQIPDDLVLNLLLFVNVGDISRFSYSNKQYYELIHETDYLWKELCRIYLQRGGWAMEITSQNDAETELVDRIEQELNKEKQQQQLSFELKLSEGNTRWRDEYRELVTFRFDSMSCDKCREMIYSNNNRSAENPQKPTSGYWATTRGQKLLKPGNRYQWTFTLETFSRDSHNTWWIMVGVENTDFPFQSQQGNDVIGYQSQHGGAALIIGPCTFTHKGDRQTPPKYVQLASGDCVGVVLDMTNSSGKSDTNTASIEFYHITESQCNRIIKATIPAKPYYPAVSMNQNQKVTIGPWPARSSYSANKVVSDLSPSITAQEETSENNSKSCILE